STGISGTIADTNSLIGSDPGDYVGFSSNSIVPLGDGNYVIVSPYWNRSRGAVTWSNGSTGISGTVSAANSLVGSNPGDRVGSNFDGNPLVTLLTNGNFVVASPQWNGNRGAVTWQDGSTGTSGTVSAANSLVGSNPDDYV